MTALESALRLIPILLLKTLDWIHRDITDDPDNTVLLATVASTWLWLEPASMVLVAWTGGLYCVWFTSRSSLVYFIIVLSDNRTDNCNALTILLSWLVCYSLCN
ncbi:hypothetical protein BDV33DRAFT_182216 [Aspergillus novoparasiticus]|uniref:Uncharacterized protein n=1 Tax=Aspergillus novoparasiticus TaxID=986946 RepID=A0A5N6EAW8_9EURO|nr:hypothetical protein BDV33DRAFT_182216 [Aspergillus novoparasiticus]